MRTRCSFLVLGLAFGLAATAPGCGDGAVEQPPPGLEFASESDLKAQRDAKDATYRTDPDSPIPPPLRAEFKALDYYPVDPGLRFRVKLRRYPGGLPLTIPTTTGKTRPATKVGYVEFRHEGAVHRLQVYHLDDLGPEHGEALFLPFLDATSGRETYGAGRYLDLAPGRGGWYVLDFNLAYHPLCAYGRTDYFCPRTPEENRLSFAVRAGERGWAAKQATNQD